MGLRVQVGEYAAVLDRGSTRATKIENDLDVIARLTRATGHESHNEPTTLPPMQHQAPKADLPYDYLHRLRRFYAHLHNDPSRMPAPLSDGQDPSEDPILAREYEQPQSHLICHSDDDGYYVPLPFSKIIIDQSGLLTGSILGSSHKLFTELEDMAARLKIGFDGDLVSRDSLLNIRDDVRNKGQYAIERLVWLTLYDACRLSLQHKTMVSFT